MIQSYPLSVRSLYSDLLEAHLTRVDIPSEDKGAPFQRKIGGRDYWYVSRRVGGKTIQRYLGPDDAETRERATTIRKWTEDWKAEDQRMAAMVAQLRAVRLPTLDLASGTLLSVLDREGVFDVGGTLIGTHAFRLYEAELGRAVTRAAPSTTDDIDIASFERLSVALATADARANDLAGALKAEGLSPVPALRPQIGAARWRTRGGLFLDFLAPSFTDDEEIVALPSLGLFAQALHFLNYLIADPIPAVALYRSGILVRVPRPERFAIHKLIVAARRSSPHLGKREKDLRQATALVEVLAEERPAELRRAHQEAWSNGPAWRDAITRSLDQAPRIRERLGTL